MSVAETMTSYPLVRRPLAIGPVKIRNRILLPAMTTNYGVDHLPSAQHAAYHGARSAGGVGLIIFESIRVHPNSLGRPQAVNGFDPACVEPFREIVSRVHAGGAAIFGQVIHLGRQVDGDFEGTVSWGASPIAWSATAVAPHEMTERDMDEVVDGHVQTVRNLLLAGFDGIELQMAHGHLLQQFISPLSNKRQDNYGGSLENRMRFPARVLQAVRAEAGPDVAVGIRLGSAEFVEHGLQLEEAEQVAITLSRSTKIDFVNVSHSAYHGSLSLGTQMADMSISDVSPFRRLPAGIRFALRSAGYETPVFAVCKFTSLAEAEDAVANGWCDAVAMARAHLADPDLVSKSFSGREHEVRRCIGCNQGCVGMLEKNLPIRCLVNPVTGREASGLWRAGPTSNPRRVLVVGGGPAGMECAITAAERGHWVTLWEGSERLGGQLAHASRMPRRRRFDDFLDFQRTQVAASTVSVELNRFADAAAIAEFGPDNVVLATGARSAPLEVPGGGLVLDLLAAMDNSEEIGPRVAVVDRTGDWPALALIEYLADLGHQVTVYTEITAFAWRTTIYSTLATSARLRKRQVSIRPLTAVRRWDGACAELEDASTGLPLPSQAFDALIGLVHPVADNQLLNELREAGLAAEQIGDALAPRTALEAVHQGRRLGLDL